MNFDQVINRKNTASLKWDALEHRFGDKDLLPLWVADMDFKAPQPVIDAIKEQVDHGIFGYSIVPDSTYQSIINWLHNKHNWSIKKDWITFSPGVVPALSTIVNAFTNPGEKIIVQPPVYYPFFSVVKLNDRKIVNNPLKLNNGQYEIDFDQLSSAIDEQVKMIIISNPHNPGGRVWKKSELEKLATICLENDILIISDEIHSDLVFEDNKHIPLASLSDQIAENTITCMAPSKTFNLAGLQTSYLVIPNENHKKRYKSYLQRQGMSDPNTIGLVSLEAAYNHGSEWLEQLMTYVKNNLETLESYIESEIPDIEVMRPEGTYLVWIDCRKLGLSSKELEQLLIKEGKVAFNQGYTFGEGGEGFIRINLACPRETLLEGLARLKKAVNSIK